MVCTAGLAVRALLLALVLTALPNVGALAQHVQMSKEQIAAVHASVKRDLRDPDSARFQDLAMVRDKGPKATSDTFMVCGYVNAKNAFGGYTGRTPFYGLLLGIRKDTAIKWAFVPISLGSDRTSIVVTFEMCSRNNLKLPP